MISNYCGLRIELGPVRKDGRLVYLAGCEERLSQNRGCISLALCQRTCPVAIGADLDPASPERALLRARTLSIEKQNSLTFLELPDLLDVR